MLKKIKIILTTEPLFSFLQIVLFVAVSYFFFTSSFINSLDGMSKALIGFCWGTLFLLLGINTIIKALDYHHVKTNLPIDIVIVKKEHLKGFEIRYSYNKSESYVHVLDYGLYENHIKEVEEKHSKKFLEYKQNS